MSAQLRALYPEIGPLMYPQGLSRTLVSRRLGKQHLAKEVEAALDFAVVVTGPVWDRSGVIVRCVGNELLRATPATSEAAAVLDPSCACASRDASSGPQHVLLEYLDAMQTRARWGIF